MPSSLSRASIVPLIARLSDVAFEDRASIGPVQPAAKPPYSRRSSRPMRAFCYALASCFLFPAIAAAATLGEARIGFSADRLLVVDGHTYQGKIWAMPGKERHEQALYGLQPVFLLRADHKLAEIVLQSLKTVVEFEIPAELRLLDLARLKTRPVGSETVNGVAT